MKRELSVTKKRVTHLDELVLSKLRSTGDLFNSLPVGSKNRLRQYCTNLSISRGINDNEINFDNKVKSLIHKYAWDLSAIRREENYLFNLKDDEGYRFSRNLKIYSKISEAMNRFAQSDYTSFRWNVNYRKSLEEFKDEFKRLRLKPLTFMCDDDIESALPKKDTHSGWYWIESGKKYKGDNIKGSYDNFKLEVDKAILEGSFNKPILLGFRTQASGEYDDQGNQTGRCKHKLRVVSMVDLMVIIAELMFSKPIQQYLADVRYYAGGKSENEISSIITHAKTRYQYFMSIDYSSYDQSISSWLIQDAFDIIKSAFVLDEYQNKIFDLVVHDFIHKRFVLNEGVLESHKGVPSGSMFTQIIDSIINVLVVKTYFNSINKDVFMMAMGDDNIIFTNYHTSLKDLSSYVMKNFGLNISVDDKANEGQSNYDDIKFLSRFWRFDGQYRHKNQLLSRLLYPERRRGYNSDIGPQHVIFAFILTYKLGMEQLINTRQFIHDYPISKQYVLSNVDSRYLPGALAYIREYT